MPDVGVRDGRCQWVLCRVVRRLIRSAGCRPRRMSAYPESPIEGGPDGQFNWRCASAGLPVNDTVEIALYSDARLTGHGGFGPYRLINTVPMDPHEQLPMAAVLRMEWHVPDRDPLPDMSRSKQDTFHGGDLPDEIAALISLALGIRVQAGGVIREFRNSGDPRGTPVQHGHRRPALPGARRRAIPSLTEGDLRRIDAILDVYPRVRPSKGIEVVRAARAYQQGLWMSDADPEYAWLKFVSALETAANCWWRGDNDVVDALRYAKPELAELLGPYGGDKLVRDVGEMLKDQVRATRRFYAFTSHYTPDPPNDRPPTAFQVDWNHLPRAMRRIYGYRSKSLHAGTPFPPPMLERPEPFEQGQPPPEKPLGLAAAVGPNVWQAEELPMLLFVFEHITRGTLLAWLRDPVGGPTA